MTISMDIIQALGSMKQAIHHRSSDPSSRPYGMPHKEGYTFLQVSPHTGEHHRGMLMKILNFSTYGSTKLMLFLLGQLVGIHLKMKLTSSQRTWWGMIQSCWEKELVRGSERLIMSLWFFLVDQWAMSVLFSVSLLTMFAHHGKGYNLSEGNWEWNGIRRNGGNFLWRQIYNAQKLGVRTMYGAMWDEWVYFFEQ